MGAIFRRFGAVVGFLLLAAYVAVALRGPQGVPGVLKKHQEIRDLHQSNADLSQEVEQRRLRNEQLRKDRAAQELAIRESGRVKKGETAIVIPDTEKPVKPSARP